MNFLLLALALAAPCREENLAHFSRHTDKRVDIEIVGAEDPCDHFGGAGACTPLYQIWVYVNFNIHADIDLDLIDDHIRVLPRKVRPLFLRVKSIAVVDAAWMEKHFRDKRTASLNWAGDTLFVSEAVFAHKGGFELLLFEFYSLNR